MKLRNFLENIDFDFQLAQLLNIESATLGISGARFTPKCNSCSDVEEIFFDCKACGITKRTFAQVRSGSGDGIYPVFQSMHGLGAAVLFDHESSFAAQHREWAFGGPSPETELALNARDILDNEIYFLGNIQAPTKSNIATDTCNLVAFADALAGEKDAVVVGDVGFGNVALFIVLGPRNRGTEKDLVPRLIIAAGQQDLPSSFVDGSANLDILPSSVGAEWFAFPVAASIGGGNAEFALFQTTKHCQAVAEMCQDAEVVELMAMWVARGLACIAKLQQLNTELAHQLLQTINQDFSEGTFETWWSGEVNYLLEKLGKSPKILDWQKSQESWFKSLGTQEELPIPLNVAVDDFDSLDVNRPKFCSECGSAVSETGSFCANCGNKIHK